MAEILGAVASGLQMAALATKTILIGFSVRALYREMQGASAEIAASLENIHIIAQILEGLRNSPMGTDVVLPIALSRCEKCVQELQMALRTLDDKIRTSRGLSSKWTCLNFIIHKDTFAKMEHRLETSLRLLLFAIQLAMLASHERLV